MCARFLAVELCHPHLPTSTITYLLPQSLLERIGVTASYAGMCCLPPSPNRGQHRTEHSARPPKDTESSFFSFSAIQFEYCCAHADKKALFLFVPTHPVRMTAARMGRSSVMEYLALGFVSVSCALLAIEDPHAPERIQLFWICEITGLCFFSFEAMIRIIDETFVLYIKNLGHALDLVVIINTVVSMFADANLKFGVQTVKILRAFRAIRMARVIARSPSMMNVVQSISLSLKEMSNVLLMVILIITIFAILGVQLFSGKLYYCTDASVPGRAECSGVTPWLCFVSYAMGFIQTVGTCWKHTTTQHYSNLNRLR
jgi:hypothetical protein